MVVIIFVLGMLVNVLKLGVVRCRFSFFGEDLFDNFIVIFEGMIGSYFDGVSIWDCVW